MSEQEERPIRLRAKDVMTSPVLTTQGETSVRELAAAMLAHHISGLPVVSSTGELIGIVTEGDLLSKGTGPGDEASAIPAMWFQFPGFKGLHASRKANALTARELMTTPVVTVDEGAFIDEIVKVMLEKKINRVPVMRKGRLVGIISRGDILKAFARTDQEIATAVCDALAQELWIDVTRLKIGVQEGIVHLRGEVELHSEMELAERCVATIDGVVRVESGLTYRFDDQPLFARPLR